MYFYLHLCHKQAIWPKKNTQALKLFFAYQLTGQLQQDQLAWPFDLEWRNLGTDWHRKKIKISLSQPDQRFRWPNVFSCTKARAIGSDRSIWKSPPVTPPPKAFPNLPGQGPGFPFEQHLLDFCLPRLCLAAFWSQLNLWWRQPPMAISSSVIMHCMKSSAPCFCFSEVCFEMPP